LILNKTADFVKNDLKFEFHNEWVTPCIIEGSNASGFVQRVLNRVTIYIFLSISVQSVENIQVPQLSVGKSMTEYRL
jgi:hypothetical protein